MPNVSTSLGPLLLGVCVNSILYGILILQCFIYHQTYKRDARWMRFFVLWLFVIETVNVVVNIAIIYEPMVLNYGEDVSLTRSPKMLSGHPIITALISTSVQFFIAWRIKAISKSRVIPAVICALALTALGGSIALTIFASHTPAIPGRPRNIPGNGFTLFIIYINIWLVASALADLLIAFSLTLGLVKRRRGGSRIDDRASSIIRFAVHTGILTATLASTNLVVSLCAPTTTFNFIWDLALSTVYTNALLSILNARPSGRLVSHVAPRSHVIEADVVSGSHYNVLFDDEGHRDASSYAGTVSAGIGSMLDSNHPTMLRSGSDSRAPSRPKYESGLHIADVGLVVLNGSDIDYKYGRTTP